MGIPFAADAAYVYLLHVRHAVRQPAGRGDPGATTATGEHEQTLEPSVHRPPAVGRKSEGESDAMPGEKKCLRFDGTQARQPRASN